MSDSTPENKVPTATPNLRVTFWGVQGSCPVFPTQDEVYEYNRAVACYTLVKTFQDIAERLERGEVTPEMLRTMAMPANAAVYQKTFGLPPLATYGGDTTCVEVLTGEGNTLLFDLGTGLRDFSRRIAATWVGRGERMLHVFATHEHLDHRNGLPFASFFFDNKRPFNIDMYGTRAYLTALDDRYGLFSHQLSAQTHVDDPLDYRMIAAHFKATEIRTSAPPSEIPPKFTVPQRDVGEPIKIGSTTVTPFEVYHGAVQCLAYKIQHGGSSFVFCTDHEIRHGDDPADVRQIRSVAAEQRLLEQCQGVDVAYFDGQYLLAEYKGKKGIGSGPPIGRMDWGHSCVEDVVSRVRQCGIRRAYIGHHDPERLWGGRVELDRHLHEISANQAGRIELAKAGDKIDI